MNDHIEVARIRAVTIAARADRPVQRRSQAEVGSRALVRAAVSGLEIRAKADDSGLEFRGHASVVEQAYDMYDMFGPYTEIVSAGAFDSTLARDGLDVPLVIAHDQTRRIARTTTGTLRLSIDDTGLLVEADLDPADGDVGYIVPKLRAGLIDEMSFAFRIDSGQWSPDYDEFRINKVDMHRGDVAIVGFGANPYTSGGMRSVADLARRSGSQVVTWDLTDPWA